METKVNRKWHIFILEITPKRSGCATEYVEFIWELLRLSTPKKHRTIRIFKTLNSCLWRQWWMLALKVYHTLHQNFMNEGSHYHLKSRDEKCSWSYNFFQWGMQKKNNLQWIIYVFFTSTFFDIKSTN